MTVYREATIQDKRYRSMRVVPDARVQAIIDMWSADYQRSDPSEEIREVWPALGELLDELTKADHDPEWPTEVSDELIAFARAAAEIARKHGTTFVKEER